MEGAEIGRHHFDFSLQPNTPFAVRAAMHQLIHRFVELFPERQNKADRDMRLFYLAQIGCQCQAKPFMACIRARHGQIDVNSLRRKVLSVILTRNLLPEGLPLIQYAYLV